MTLIELIIFMLPFLFSGIIWQLIFKNMGLGGAVLAIVLGFSSWGLLLVLLNLATRRRQHAP
jgi:hypothetical protein